MSRIQVKKMVLSALMLALCLVLPFLTGQIPQIGRMLLPMHIPVLLCGFICGWPWALAVGFVAPILRSTIFTMPMMFPDAVSMAFELAVYGFVTGIFYEKLPKTKGNTVLSLIAAMVCGRIVWGVVRLTLTALSATEFSWAMFVAGAVTTAVPGLILQIVLIPLIVFACEKKKLIPLQG